MLSLVDNENGEVIRKLPSDAVMAIVKAYNNVLATIKSQTSYDVEAQKGSDLVGDRLARRVQSQVRDTLNMFAADGDIRS